MIGTVFKWGGLFLAVTAAVTLSICFLVLCIYFIIALVKEIKRKLSDRNRSYYGR